MKRTTVVALLTIYAVLAGVNPAVAQAAAEDEQTPRTAWGAPDLQGVWDFRTLTPLQRPEEFEGREVLTADEASAREERAQAGTVDRPPPPGNPGGYNRFWMDDPSFAENERTSLIVDPPDGRIPALQPGVAHQKGSLGEDLPSTRPIRYRVGGSGTDGPEDRGLAERCILGFNSGPPLLPGGYNQNIQVFQTPDHVVILNEMVHDVRVVPLDGRPHLEGDLRQWMGDPRGHWEGDTLVVESTNFSSLVPSFNPSVASAMGTGESLRLIERFTRVGADTMRYEYTVDDSETFDAPFTAQLPLRRSDQAIFEYACHEGNYGLLNILRGAREAEGASASATGAGL